MQNDLEIENKYSNLFTIKFFIKLNQNLKTKDLIRSLVHFILLKYKRLIIRVCFPGIFTKLKKKSVIKSIGILKV